MKMTKAVKLNCMNYSGYLYNLSALQDFILQTYEGYKITKLDYENFIVEFEIDSRNVKLNVTSEEINDVDICVICCWFSFLYKYNDTDVKKWASHCKKLYPNASIIIFSNQAELRKKPEYAKYAELNGEKFMNQAAGNRLANEIGAVKYIECSTKGRGAKILFDEIAYAGLLKFKKAEKQQDCCVQ